MATTWSTSSTGGIRLFWGSLSPCLRILRKRSSLLGVRNRPAFLTDYLNWKRKSDDDPTKTLDALRTAMKNIIEDARRDKLREDEKV